MRTKFGSHISTRLSLQNPRFQDKIRAKSMSLRRNTGYCTKYENGKVENLALKSQMTLTHSHSLADYNDVIMSAMVSQITTVSIVCLTVCSCADQRKHQSSASLAFVRGIHRWPVSSPPKGPVTRQMFPFDDVTRDLWNIDCGKFEEKKNVILQDSIVHHVTTLTSVDLPDRPGCIWVCTFKRVFHRTHTGRRAPCVQPHNVR